MEELKRSDYFYELPEELIAQDPLERRDQSRLLVLDRAEDKTSHLKFNEVGGLLRSGDCLVLNDTKVIPARLIGELTGSGRAVEILLLKRLCADTWETIVRPGKKLRKGAIASFGGGILNAEITEVLPDGNRIVRFFFEGIFEEILDRLGEMPLPPYIKHRLSDPDRYQTVYAKNPGSAAAPTAGLHFTKELLSGLREKGVIITFVTLHVGLGTFRPVKEENLLMHKMHSEYFEVSSGSAETINRAKENGGRVIAVGTTSCRTLESAADDNGRVRECSGETKLFIYPGYRFKVIDALITNFHLPESTLLMLVSAFAGRERILNAYREAIAEGYRFFSFGDAMLLK